MCVGGGGVGHQRGGLGWGQPWSFHTGVRGEKNGVNKDDLKQGTAPKGCYNCEVNCLWVIFP